jgi:hypothetical protein
LEHLNGFIIYTQKQKKKEKEKEESTSPCALTKPALERKKLRPHPIKAEDQ